MVTFLPRYLFVVVEVGDLILIGSVAAHTTHRTHKSFPTGHAIRREGFFFCSSENNPYVWFSIIHGMLCGHVCVHMCCLIYITRASLGPLHPLFFLRLLFASIRSFVLVFCNWIDTQVFFSPILQIWTRLMKNGWKSVQWTHSWWKYEKHGSGYNVQHALGWHGQKRGNLLFAACRSCRLFSFIFNWTQATA